MLYKSLASIIRHFEAAESTILALTPPRQSHWRGNEGLSGAQLVAFNRCFLREIEVRNRRKGMSGVIDSMLLEIFLSALGAYSRTERQAFRSQQKQVIRSAAAMDGWR